MPTPFYTYTPNYAGVALLHAELLKEVSEPSLNTGQRDMLLRVFLGSPTGTWAFDYQTRPFGQYTDPHRRPPCSMLVSQSADCVYIGLSGCKTAIGLQDAVHDYLTIPTAISPSYMGPIVRRPSLNSWAHDYIDAAAAMGMVVTGKHIRISGHSLGGAIGTDLAFLCSRIPGVRSVHLCSFGAPKSWYSVESLLSSIVVARWVNPEDNVPRLPPAPAQAPDVWALLSVDQRTNVLRWRHPARGLEVTSNGAINLVDDQPSMTLTLNTLLQAVNSPQGVTGPGHSLATYEDYLRQAASGFIALPETETIAPQTPGPNPVAIPTNTNVPPVAPPQPSNAQNVARRVAYAAAASSREVGSPVVPEPAKVHAVKLDGWYAIEWCGFIISYAPTKKKARACARHLNTFLRLFIGVGSCDSNAFVMALATWLNLAADPTSGFLPSLNDNGTGATINIS